MHRATRRFWECFANLSEDIQSLARKNYALLKANPHHPSLQFKKIGHLWSARVGLHLEPSPLRTAKALYGSGLVRMLSTNA